jgi:hypothetical protein
VKTLWDWLGSSQAGNLAQWVGGVGTAGALLLGFVILLRDKRRESLSQARRVFSVITTNESHTCIRVENGSDQPISYLGMILRPMSRRSLWLENRLRPRDGRHAARADPYYLIEKLYRQAQPILSPGESVTYVLERRSYLYQYVLSIVFSDAQGRDITRRENVHGGARYRGGLYFGYEMWLAAHPRKTKALAQQSRDFATLGDEGGAGPGPGPGPERTTGQVRRDRRRQ